MAQYPSVLKAREVNPALRALLDNMGAALSPVGCYVKNVYVRVPGDTADALQMHQDGAMGFCRIGVRLGFGNEGWLYVATGRTAQKYRVRFGLGNANIMMTDFLTGRSTVTIATDSAGVATSTGSPFHGVAGSKASSNLVFSVLFDVFRMDRTSAPPT